MTPKMSLKKSDPYYMRFKANQKRFKKRMAEIRRNLNDIIPKDEIYNQEVFLKELEKHYTNPKEVLGMVLNWKKTKSCEKYEN